MPCLPGLGPSGRWPEAYPGHASLPQPHYLQPMVELLAARFTKYYSSLVAGILRCPGLARDLPCQPSPVIPHIRALPVTRIQSCTSMISVIRRTSHGITRTKLISPHIMLKTHIDSLAFTCEPSMALHKPQHQYEGPCNDFVAPHMFHLSERRNYRGNDLTILQKSNIDQSHAIESRKWV
jgi:hypothetical protein